MSSSIDPWDIPQWHNIGREAALVRHLVGSGVTALGKANYADKIGEYYTAFFGLSIGLERLCKLIIVVDYALSNKGLMPEEKIVRRFGHKIKNLTDEAAKISDRHRLKLEYVRPHAPITLKIIECLDAFADAGRGRYANFAALGDPNLGAEEPIRRWWGEVGTLILSSHYSGKAIQDKIENNARVIDFFMSPVSAVHFVDEAGRVMDDVFSSSVRTGQAKIVQRFGRYYALILVRWLSEVFSELSRSASYDQNIDALFGVWEYFQTFTVSDDFIKTRKTWPLR